MTVHLADHNAPDVLAVGTIRRACRVLLVKKEDGLFYSHRLYVYWTKKAALIAHPFEVRRRGRASWHRNVSIINLVFDGKKWREIGLYHNVKD